VIADVGATVRKRARATTVFNPVVVKGIGERVVEGDALA